MREREAKLVVDESFVVPALDDAIDGATLGEPRRHTVNDVYFDTADLRLARWGCTLRRRQGEGWTVKIPSPSTGAVLDREEVTYPGPPGRPPDEPAALVMSLSRGAHLVSVGSFSTRRVTRRWRDGDGSVVAELTDDSVEATTCAGGVVRFRELEVELAPTTKGSVLDLVIEQLVGGRPLDPAMPKLVRVLGVGAQDPPDVVAEPLGKHPTVGAVIRAALASSVARMLLQLPGAWLGVDPEGVHQARVATRRLRSDLRTFSPLLDRPWVDLLRTELGWLARALGEVRDADVLSMRFEDLLIAHPEIDRWAATRVIGQLHAQRRGHLDDLRLHLADERARGLYDHLVAAVAHPELTEQADRPAREVMARLVAKPWRRLDRSIGSLGGDPSVEELHQVRILAKRVRYTTEAVAPAFGKKARRFGRAAARIQDVLGDLNDAAVAEAWLEGVVPGLGVEPAFAAGRMAQQLTAEARPDNRKWRKAHARMVDQSSWLER